MREVVSNTSPLLYLHQLGSIDLLPAVLLPPSVVEGLAAGRAAGHDVPNVAALPWASVVSSPTLAKVVGVTLTGTLSVLTKAKTAGYIPTVAPWYRD
jgi:predicted nucleic acid-binding protein